MIRIVSNLEAPKTCRSCGETKPFISFYKRRRVCIPCYLRDQRSKTRKGKNQDKGDMITTPLNNKKDKPETTVGIPTPPNDNKDIIPREDFRIPIRDRIKNMEYDIHKLERDTIKRLDLSALEEEMAREISRINQELKILRIKDVSQGTPINMDKGKGRSTKKDSMDFFLSEISEVVNRYRKISLSD